MGRLMRQRRLTHEAAAILLAEKTAELDAAEPANSPKDVRAALSGNDSLTPIPKSNRVTRLDSPSYAPNAASSLLPTTSAPSSPHRFHNLPLPLALQNPPRLPAIVLLTTAGPPPRIQNLHCLSRRSEAKTDLSRRNVVKAGLSVVHNLRLPLPLSPIRRL